MVVSIKDSLKLIGVSIISCCAVMLCTMFINYLTDLTAVKASISAAALTFYDAQIMTAKVVAAVCGCCLLLTSVITLLFYVKQYIDAHKKELGILKALGYSNVKISANFLIFGLSVLLGTAIGFAIAYAVMPSFYRVQNADGILPQMSPEFHAELLAYFVILPTIAFSAFAALYACYKLRKPAIDLLKDVEAKNYKKHKDSKVKNEKRNGSFLKDLAIGTLKGKKTLVFFMWFAAFCFATTFQMGLGMNELASAMMAAMMIVIGVALAVTTLLLAITTVVRSNVKPIAILRAYGYKDAECANAVLGGYRPFAYLGFAMGTVYQYGLLKLMVTLVFKDIEGVPEYKFDFVALGIALAVFVVAYEAVMLIYSEAIKRISLRQIMSE